MASFDGFVWWVFCGLISGCAVYGVSVLAKLVESIRLLNIQIAQLIERSIWHEKALDDHDDRLKSLEKNN